MVREQGSSFYKIDGIDDEYQVLKNSEISLNQHYAIYYSGRSAMYAILEHIKTYSQINTLWIPDYYCKNVVNFLKRNYPNLKTYYINAFDCKQIFNYKKFAKYNDVIILNNFWGLFNYNIDNRDKNKPIIIEDFSHGWLTKQCLDSKADYCIASVRKSYPIPGGGVAWIPNKNFEFYQKKSDIDALIAFEKLKASLYKKYEFLKKNAGNKQAYLDLLLLGETYITASNSYIKPHGELYSQIEDYIKFNLNTVKSKNLKVVRPLIKPSPHFKIIEREGFSPFGLMLLFKDELKYQNFKSFCINHQIYPANLWPNNTLKTKWKHFLNFHVDFRYNDKDMHYLAGIINKWSDIDASK